MSMDKLERLQKTLKEIWKELKRFCDALNDLIGNVDILFENKLNNNQVSLKKVFKI